jgi:hypothetical protein
MEKALSDDLEGAFSVNAHLSQETLLEAVPAADTITAG